MNFDEKHCSGCGACISICPKECISFITNDRGNIVPRIDEQLCIHCNLCKKTCPREHLTKKINHFIVMLHIPKIIIKD